MLVRSEETIYDSTPAEVYNGADYFKAPVVARSN
jgi:hypothetical protein